MDNLSQFNEVFFEEAQEHLETMETLLLAFDVDAPDIEELNSVFRAAHSIKGGSGIFGFTAMTGLTHVMENMLDSARNSELALTSGLITVLLETVDVLKEILNCYRNEEEIDWDSVKTAEAVIENAHRDTSSEQSATVGDVLQAGTDDNQASDLEEDDGFGFFDEEPDSSEDDDGFGFFDDEPDTSADEGFGLFENEEPKEEFGFFDETLNARIEKEAAEDEDGFGFFDPLPNDQEQQAPNNVVSAEQAAPPEPPVDQQTSNIAAKPLKKAVSKPETKTTEATSIRVETNKIDKLVNLVGELVITQSMLNLIGNEVQESMMDKMQTALAELERNTREIQEAVMSVRMLPISFVFNRFPRLVRDLSVKMDKKIDLVIEGASTEIDKNLVEKISDPLTHLIRNSIDHGIEMPDVRRENGKDETGKVKLSATQKGGEIIISITDDGAGLNRERILNKALEKGISLPDPLTDEAIWQLIFSPGFSTAAEITDVSGRGVGMDVVRRNIESLGGRVDISSTQGQGSEFQISLPLTLAILDGMCVESSGQVFVVPLVNIVESIQPSKEQIKVIKNNPILWVREEYWPLVDIGKTLSGSESNGSIDQGIVVLVETAKSRFGLMVDSLVGQQQVVIKSLERHFKRVEGVAGATIMGDGSVALILDVDSLTQFINTDVKGELAHVSQSAG